MNKQKRIISIFSLCLIAVLSLCLSIAMFKVKATLVGYSGNGYAIMTDDNNNFVGVNVRNSTNGEIVVTPNGDGTTATSRNILISYNFDAVDKSKTDGILIYIDRSTCANTLQGWILFGNSVTSTYYRAYVDDNMWVNPSGNIRDLSVSGGIGSNFNYSFPSKIVGTLYIPWTSVKNMSGSEISGTPSIGSMHFVYKTTTASQLDEAKKIAIASISSLKKDADDFSKYEVTTLIDTTKLSYTNDIDDTTSDINFADLSKGNRVNVSKTLSGTTVSSVDADHLSKIKFGKTDLKLKVNYVDEFGAKLKESTENSIAFSEYRYSYSVTAPEIENYTFRSDLSGNVEGTITENTTLNFVYERKKVESGLYTIIKDSENNFAGVNLQAKQGGGLEIVPDTTKAQSGYNDLVIDYKFDKIKMSKTSGLLVSVNRSKSTKTLYAMIMLKNANNDTRYKVLPQGCVFIDKNGEEVEISQEGSANFKFDAKIQGTLYIPWTNVKNISGSEIANDPDIGGLCLVWKSSSSAQIDADRRISINAISYIVLDEENLDDSKITTLLDCTSLVYTDDDTCETADVNLSDITKGKTISISKAFIGNGFRNIDVNDEEFLKTLTFTRFDVQVKVNYVYASGGNIFESVIVNVPYDNGFAYSFEQINAKGFSFVADESDPLVGSVETDSELTFKYEHTPLTELADTQYSSIKKKGVDYGVRLNTSNTGAIKIIPDGRTTPTTSKIVITFVLNGFKVADGDGILINIDRSFAPSNLSPNIALESYDGIIYYAKIDNCVFINEDDTVNSNLGTAGSTTFTLQKRSCGTLFIPFSSIYSSGRKTLDSKVTAIPKTGTTIADSTIISKMDFIWQGYDERQLETGRATSIGDIALLKTNDSEKKVYSLLDHSSLTYATTADDADKDVNINNMASGKTIYTKYTLLGWDMTRTESDLEALTYSRNYLNLTVRYVDENDNEIEDPSVYEIEYDREEDKFIYEISKPEINAFVFDENDNGLLTGEILQDTMITLHYADSDYPSVRLDFVDEEGKKLLRSTYAFVEPNGANYNYSCTVPNIFGYKIKDIDNELDGTFDTDMVIKVTYQKNAIKDCGIVLDEYNDFVGVNIKNDVMGTALIVGNNSGSPTRSLAMATYEMKAVKVKDTLGILLKIDRTAASSDQVPRIMLERDDGALYKISDGTYREDVFINSDGSIGFIKSEQFRYNLESNISGTVFIPWSALTSTGTAMPGSTAVVDGNRPVEKEFVFTKLHFALDSRGPSLQGVDRPTAICVIGAVGMVDGKIVTDELLDVASLNYSYDETVNGDVNMIDFSKGEKVYIKHSITGSYQVDVSDEERSEATNVLVIKRLTYKVTVEYVDEDGMSLRQNSVYQAEYDGDVLVYHITPPNIVGYDYVSANKELQGTVTDHITISLTYEKKTIYLTLKFVDEKGNEIHEAVTVTCTYGKYTEIEPIKIDGHEFIKSSNTLKLTPLANKTITLTYKSNPNYTIFVIIGVGVLALAGAGVVLFVRKKRK